VYGNVPKWLNISQDLVGIVPFFFLGRVPWIEMSLKESERCSTGEGLVVKRSMEEANENWWFTGPFRGRHETFPAANIFGSGKTKTRFITAHQSSKPPL